MKHRLVVSQDNMNLNMLMDIFANSYGTIEKMLCTEEVRINEKPKDGNNIITWISDTEKQKKDIYENFVLRLCEYSKRRRRQHRDGFVPKYLENGNEKAYAYGLFNVIGMFGDKYRSVRQELMKPLNGTTGSSTRFDWRAKVSEEEEEQ